jgi:hypothetical protein
MNISYNKMYFFLHCSHSYTFGLAVPNEATLISMLIKVFF